MPNVDDIKEDFIKKLEKEKTSRKLRFDDEINQLHNALSSKNRSITPESVAESINRIETHTSTSRQNPPPLPFTPQALVNITNSSPLSDLDNAFLRIFKLTSYYPTSKLNYPTILCESLEEFFTPFLANLNYSEQAREQSLKNLISEAIQTAEKNKGGIFGVNFPGQGCYLNGWLFAKLAGIKPRDVSRDPNVFQTILGTASHEKLGHGFISAYSALGQLKTELGLSLVQIASQFGISPSDDASVQLRYKQNSLLFFVSQFLEEGWATWIEKYLEVHLFHTSNPLQHSLNNLIGAIQQLPKEIPNVEHLKEALMQSLGIVLGDEDQTMKEILQAVYFLADTGGILDEYFMSCIHQPLRYALGELICKKCEANLGELCVPYAVLIAGNVTFDPTKISATDLSNLLLNDPRLNPDTRLVAISRMKLETPGDIKELTKRVNSELSFSIPVEIR
jgi:hypothetical protein